MILSPDNTRALKISRKKLVCLIAYTFVYVQLQHNPCSLFSSSQITVFCKMLKRKYRNKLGTAVAQWLRCCATNRKVAGSIPPGVIGIFY